MNGYLVASSKLTNNKTEVSGIDSEKSVIINFK